MTVSDAAMNLMDSAGDVAMTGAVSNVVKHQVEHVANKVSKKVLKKTLDANTVGKVVGAAMSLKDCTARYINGEIDSKEYLFQVLEDGTGSVVSSL